MAIHENAATGFARASEAYERGRPGFADEVVGLLRDELRLGPGVRLLELGAGTGKLTRLLAPLGPEILVVEPVEEMLARLREHVPQAERVGGTAEAVELPDGSVDAIVAAQAFHWFDAPVALREMHRVLRPDGRVGLVWNRRDESVDWVSELGAAVRAAALGHAGLRPGPLARAVRRHDAVHPARAPPPRLRAAAHARRRRRPGRLDLVRGLAAGRAAGRRARPGARRSWPRIRPSRAVTRSSSLTSPTSTSAGVSQNATVPDETPLCVQGLRRVFSMIQAGVLPGSAQPDESTDFKGSTRWHRSFSTR